MHTSVTTDQPRVTVVIPTHDRAEWLPGAIESVLAQTWRDFALVVSDNASTDGTAAAVARFDDPRLSYARLDRHVGLNAHFNLWLEGTRSEYLLLLPDDDRMAPDLLERTVAVLDANPRAGMAHGQVTVVGADGGSIAERHGMTGLPGDAVESGREFIARTIDMSYRVHASTALIRTAALDGIALDARDYPVTDLGLWLRMALRWEIAYIARPLATYRIHAGAYSAAAASVTEGGYLETDARILASQRVKLRFIAEHAESLDDPRRLRRRARRRFRAELVAHAANAADARGGRGAGLRALAACARHDPRVPLLPAAWRPVATSAIGPRGVAALKRLLGRPDARTEAIA